MLQFKCTHFYGHTFLVHVWGCLIKLSQQQSIEERFEGLIQDSTGKDRKH